MPCGFLSSFRWNLPDVPAADFFVGAAGGEAFAVVEDGDPEDLVGVFDGGDDFAAEAKGPDAEASFPA